MSKCLKIYDIQQWIGYIYFLAKKGEKPILQENEKRKTEKFSKGKTRALKQANDAINEIHLMLLYFN